MKILQFVLLTICAGIWLCDAESRDGSDLVNELKNSLPLNDNDVIPSGQAYLKMMQLVSTVLESDKFAKYRNWHTAKWHEADSYGTRDTGSEFNCPIERSPVPPSSVHELRPADIDVIATIGDSLSAGMGIYSRTLITIFTQYRGHSFTMGGKEALETHTTLPTILKKFNPRLFGYSTGISGPDGVYAGFNEAVVGDRAENMPGQAKRVVEKLKKSRDVDFANDWKLINLFIGGNDVCDHCKDKERFSPDNYEKHVRNALDYLYDNVPKAFVNLVELMDVAAVSDLKDQSLICKALLQTFWCKCGSTLSKQEVHEYSVELQRRLRIIAEDPKWTSREDFTVVLQPFLRHISPPLLPNGQPDLSYFAPDCFHLSDKGHAIGGVSLWNNMLEPVGNKRTNWIIGDQVNCPTKQRPFLATKVNSE